MIPLAHRVQEVADSITLAVSAKAAAMKKAGVDVVGFGAGEPDFDTPAFIKDAAVQAASCPIGFDRRPVGRVSWRCAGECTAQLAVITWVEVPILDMQR